MGKTLGPGMYSIVSVGGLALSRVSNRFAVAMAVYAVGRLSGAHLNPAVTIGLASIVSFPWSDAPVYIAAQLIGAFTGSVLVWLAYLPHWPATSDYRKLTTRLVSFRLCHRHSDSHRT